MKCPCCSNKSYAKCCEPFIIEKKQPPTPESLMRSRYTAYTKANIDYIEQTMAGPALQNFNRNHNKQWAKQVKWLGLKVIRSFIGGNNAIGPVAIRVKFVSKKK